MLTIYKPDWVWRGEIWTATRFHTQRVPAKEVRVPLAFIFWAAILLIASAVLLFRGVTQKVEGAPMIVTMVLMGITLPILVLITRGKKHCRQAPPGGIHPDVFPMVSSSQLLLTAHRTLLAADTRGG